ncbi:MAG: NAD(P)-dependent oxidoreductase [Erythrobacter sp.]
MSFADRVLVTGSGGILGRHVCNSIAKIAPDAEVLRNRAELTDFSAVKDHIQSLGELDLVLHLAAMVPTSDVDADPARAFAVNVGGTINVLTSLNKSSAKLVLCSSSHVYASSPDPLSEGDLTVPISTYGKSKLLAENAAQEICAATDRPLTVARLFSIHDPAQTGSYLRPSLERKIAQADRSVPFELFGADSVRDFLPAAKAAEILVRLALSDENGVVNVASGTPVRVSEFAQSLAPFPLEIKSMGDANCLIANVSRLRSILGEYDV